MWFLRERNVDVKRSRELQGFLDAIRRGQEQVTLVLTGVIRFTGLD